MKIGILGYGNLGRAIAAELQETPHELVAIFSRRLITDTKYKVEKREKLLSYQDELDALIIATSSRRDAISDTLEFLPYFNTIDSFDMHKRIPEYRDRADGIAKENRRVAILSCGWDPGLLSLARAMASISVGAENINTFWGFGKSLGHTSALMSIPGVRRAIQYTVPRGESLTLSKNKDAYLTDEDRHRRECFIVADPTANRGKIEETIKNMDGYFKGYETNITFISEPEFLEKHRSEGHRGEIISTKIKNGEKTLFDLKLEISSNSEFTAKIMISYLNAINYLQNQGFFGAFTPLDIPMSLLISPDKYNAII